MSIDVILPDASGTWLGQDFALATCAAAVYGEIPDSDRYEHVTYDVSGVQWSVLWDDAVAVLAIRGSDETIDWIRNVSLIYRRVPMGQYWSNVHEGFWSVADLIWKHCDTHVRDLMVHGGRELMITGHSLGGAAAGVLGAIWPIGATRITSFGAPPFLARHGLYGYDDYHRYVNPLDPMPFVPKSYHHAGRERYLTQRGISDVLPWGATIMRWSNNLLGRKAIQRQHDVTLYLQRMAKAAQA